MIRCDRKIDGLKIAITESALFDCKCEIDYVLCHFNGIFRKKTNVIKFYRFMEFDELIYLFPIVY